MRRFSQRNSLVTLSDINITPLLDLAFVLLIIFVITTPLLEQGMNLKLPVGGAADKTLNKNDIRTIEVGARGVYMLDGRVATIDRIEAELIKAHKANPDTLVFIRADENGLNKDTYAIIDRCQRNGITRFSLRTKPPK